MKTQKNANKYNELSQKKKMKNRVRLQKKMNFKKRIRFEPAKEDWVHFNDKCIKSRCGNQLDVANNRK